MPDADQAAVAERVRQWRFSYRDDESVAAHDAIRAAGLRGDSSKPATSRAVAAVRVVLAARRPHR